MFVTPTGTSALNALRSTFQHSRASHGTHVVIVPHLEVQNTKALGFSLLALASTASTPSCNQSVASTG
jgi:hypothetical protein